MVLRLIISSFLFVYPCGAADTSTSEEELSLSIKLMSLEHHHTHVPYDYEQHETHQFIEKIRQKNTPVRNSYSEPVSVSFTIHRDKQTYVTTYTIDPKKTITLGGDEILLKAQFLSHSPKLYFNLIEGPEKYTLDLSSTHKPYSPTFIEYVNFVPKFLSPLMTPKFPHLATYGPLYSVNPPNNLSQDFIKQYDDHLHYVIFCIFHQEQIPVTHFFDKLNNLYNKKHYFPHLFNLGFTKTVSSLIPKKVHCIWLTHTDKPREFSEKYIEFTIRSIEACSPAAGYKHYLWVLNKEDLPETVKNLKGVPIKIKEVKKLGDFGLKSAFEAEVSKKRFGRSSDILRLEILKKKGGTYRDTDYRIHQSLDPLLMSYDFVASREPMSTFIGNAFIAVKPNHPIINAYLELISRNYDLLRVKRYIADIPESDGFGTILATGPGLFTIAVAKTIDTSDNKDIILPGQYIYPTPTKNYPQITVVKPDEPVPVEAFGVHYWDSSWTQLSTFGSVG